MSVSGVYDGSPPGFLQTWNPLTQNVTLLSENGIYYTFQIQAIDSYNRTVTSYACLNAWQIGAGVLVSIVLFLIIPRVKWFKPVFFLNECAVIVLVIRAVLSMSYYMSPAVAMSVGFTGGISFVSSKWTSISVGASIMQLFLVIIIMTSLFCQVRVIFTNQKVMQFWVSIVAACISLVVSGFWVALCAYTSIKTFNGEPSDIDGWFWTTGDALFAGAISLFCGVFFYKLYEAIQVRARLNLKQFSPLHVVAIMAAQTMVIPAVLTIADVAMRSSRPTLRQLTTPLTVFFMILSSMWATSLNTNPHPSSLGSFSSSSKFSSQSEQSSGNKINAKKSLKPSFSSTASSRFGSTFLDKISKSMVRHISLSSQDTGQYNEFENNNPADDVSKYFAQGPYNTNKNIDVEKGITTTLLKDELKSSNDS